MWYIYFLLIISKPSILFDIGGDDGDDGGNGDMYIVEISQKSMFGCQSNGYTY